MTTGLFLVCVLVAASCSPAGSGGPDGVVVIGDSITNLAADEVARRESEDYRFTIRAMNNATSRRMLQIAEELPGPSTEQVIINVGTNDINQGVDAEFTITNIEAIAEHFDRADCVHLSTLNEHIFSLERPTLPDRAEEMNLQIRQLAEEDSRYRVIDWNAAVEQYIDAGKPDGPILYDTVHPTEVGQRLLTDLYVDAIRDC